MISQGVSGKILSDNRITGYTSAAQEIIAELSDDCELTGKVSQEAELVGAVNTDETLNGEVHVSGDAPVYDGEYEVTPKANGQELKTKNLYMTEDVTIHAIPFFEVGNTSGGNTVYIANEIEFEQVK